MSRIVKPDALVEVGQDIQTLMRAGAWMSVIGTGYLLAKDWRTGLTVLGRTAWAIATQCVRLGLTISRIWWEEVFRPAIFRTVKPPPPTGPGTVIEMTKSPKGVWKPKRGFGGGGASAFFLFGGVMVQSIVNMSDKIDEWLGLDQGDDQFNAV